MGKTASPKKPKVDTKGKSGRKYRKSITLKTFILSIVIVVVVFILIFSKSYRIPSRSMEDTLLHGDLLIIETFTPLMQKISTDFNLDFGLPKVGELVVFVAPEDPIKNYIKRCLAGPGQVVEIVEKIPYVDGVRALDPILSKYIDSNILSQNESSRDNMIAFEVPDRSIFVIGDNRDNSRDSRHWGTVSYESIIGYPIFIYYSMSPDKSINASMWGKIISWPRQVRWSRIFSRIP